MAGDLPTETHIYTKELLLDDRDRDTLRKKAVNVFLSEQGGEVKNGIKHITKYRYNVEKLKDGRLVFLLKPTWLNKGIDFQVMVEKFDKGKDASILSLYSLIVNSNINVTTPISQRKFIPK